MDHKPRPYTFLTPRQLLHHMVIYYFFLSSKLVKDQNEKVIEESKHILRSNKFGQPSFNFYFLEGMAHAKLEQYREAPSLFRDFLAIAVPRSPIIFSDYFQFVQICITGCLLLTGHINNALNKAFELLEYMEQQVSVIYFKIMCYEIIIDCYKAQNRMAQAQLYESRRIEKLSGLPFAPTTSSGQFIKMTLKEL